MRSKPELYDIYYKVLETLGITEMKPACILHGDKPDCDVCAFKSTVVNECGLKDMTRALERVRGGKYFQCTKMQERRGPELAV